MTIPDMIWHENRWPYRTPRQIQVTHSLAKLAHHRQLATTYINPQHRLAEWKSMTRALLQNLQGWTRQAAATSVHLLASLPVARLMMQLLFPHRCNKMYRPCLCDSWTKPAQSACFKDGARAWREKTTKWRPGLETNDLTAARLLLKQLPRRRELTTAHPFSPASAWGSTSHPVELALGYSEYPGTCQTLLWRTVIEKRYKPTVHSCNRSAKMWASACHPQSSPVASKNMEAAITTSNPSVLSSFSCHNAGPTSPWTCSMAE